MAEQQQNLEQDNFGYKPAKRRFVKRKRTDETTEGTTSPTKKTPRRQLQPRPSTSRYNVNVHNRYEKLSPQPANVKSEIDEEFYDSHDDDDGSDKEAEIPMDEADQTVVDESIAPKKKSTKNKPTPIVIHGELEKFDKFKQKLRQLAPGGFYIKNTQINTQIFVEKEEEKEAIKNHMDTIKVDYHSYTNKSQRNHAFIAKGLAGNVTAAEIADELRTMYKIETEKIFAINNRNNTNFPFFLVITNNKVTLEQLKRSVKILNYTSVTWTRQVNKKRTVQCHRCQIWGHATSNCHAQTRCMKCAENHWTRDCPINIETGPLKCINCDDNHAANSTNCPVYQDRINFLNSKRTLQPRKTATTATPQLQNENEFPQLKKTTTNPAPWASYGNHTRDGSINNNANTSASVKTIHETNNKLKTLEAEINELNSLINLDACIRAIRDLNSLLQQCKGNEIEKFQTLHTFFENIGTYGI